MFYAFIGRKMIARGGMIDVREVIVNRIYGTRKTATICSDLAGKNVLEYVKCIGNAETDPSPILSRKVGERKWRGVSADGEIFVETRYGIRFYERR